LYLACASVDTLLKRIERYPEISSGGKKSTERGRKKAEKDSAAGPECINWNNNV